MDIFGVELIERIGGCEMSTKAAKMSETLVFGKLS